MLLTDAELDSYRSEGYVVRRRCFDAAPVAWPLAAALLRTAVPGGSDGAGAAAAPPLETVQHLLAHELIAEPEPEPEPGAVLASLADWVVTTVAGVASPVCGGRPLRHSMLSLLGGAAPAAAGASGYQQHWHKDCHWWHSGVRSGSADEVSLAELCHSKHVQFNAPLLPSDACLQLVPASHRRGTTPLEREAAAATQMGDHSVAMRHADAIGGVTITLEPGDIVFWDMLLVHRGWNPEGNPRMTLHGALWSAETPVMMHEQGQELHVRAVMNRLDAVQRKRLTVGKDTAVAEWSAWLGGYLRQCPFSGVEAGSLLKLLRTHQRRGRAPDETPPRVGTARL